MAEQETGAASDEESSGSWRRGWASAGAILATILLIGLIAMVTISNRQRDEALAWERHTYDVMLLTRTVDASIARSEAALGRYVLNEDPETGTLYYTEWRAAGRQIGELQRLVRRDPDQRARTEQLTALYQKRGQELSTAATAAAAKQGSGGVNWFFQAGKSRIGPELRAKLAEIAGAERNTLRARMEETRMFAAQANKFTEWLGWLGVLIGIGAIVLGLLAYRAITDRLLARQEADTEANRAMVLERAVQERTRELRDANDRLRAEAAERAAAEAQLRQVQKMEAVGQLTGGIAHDFNNMLAVIVGGIDLAKRKLRGPKREVELHLDNAMEGATRAAALTRRLLAFARSEPLMPEAVAPGALVEGMLDLVDRSIGERITVSTHFASEPWQVWADGSQLENAILNLCVNARDAMNGQGQLNINIDNVAVKAGEVGELAPGDYVRISVADTGVGIAPEHLERVFEPFFTTKPVGKGTGLGLSQIFGFARQSGGDVAIASSPNVGTTVSIYLPRSTRSADVGQERMRSTAAAETPRPAPSGTEILVVEDDPRVSRATVGSLNELGYRPVACASGPEALQILEQNPAIELVITDVMMPEMTGPELVRVVGDLYPHIAILFVTGFVGEAGEAEELTGHDLLRKPFTVSALAEAVAKALVHRFSGLPHPSASEAAE
jgi:signal transduction histidine kinase/ActR/RegA family two-component response regulator